MTSPPPNSPSGKGPSTAAQNDISESSAVPDGEAERTSSSSSALSVHPARPQQLANPTENSPRRRRRRRKPKSGTESGVTEPAAHAQPANAREPARERRSRSGTRQSNNGKRAEQKPGRKKSPNVPQGPAPLAVVQSAIKQTVTKAVEVPLTREEVAELKRQFQFLRDYRKQLKLKLNAQEDLLINGAREPEHRGVCQHLLAKVDYSRVVAAAESLAPKERLHLVEGVMRFSSELSYLLLYLECLKDSGHAGATAALSHALARIDFEGVSEGQMRRVLELIVELFSSSERPKLLLSLLESATFRNAFDGALQKLPGPLQELVSPLRAVHEVVLRGRRNPVGRSALRAGIKVLLEGGLNGLERRSPGFRGRLLSSALTELSAEGLTLGGAIPELVDSFRGDAEVHQSWQFRYITALLRTGNGNAAKKQLNKLFQLAPDHEAGRYYEKLLNAPRLGAFALLRGKGRLPFTSRNPLRAAVCLTSQRDVWLRTADASITDETFDTAEPKNSSSAELAQSGEEFVTQRGHEAALLFPSCIPQYSFDVDESGKEYVTYLRHGDNGATAIRKVRTISTATALCVELVLVSSALSVQGWKLPDFNWDRFEVDTLGRLWLLERWDAALAETSEALNHNFQQSKGRVVEFLDGVTSTLVPAPEALERFPEAPLLDGVERAATHEELLRALLAIGGPKKRGR